MTAASVVSRWSSGWASTMMRVLRPTEMMRDSTMPWRTHWRTRSSRPAPRFWPTKLVMAAPRALLTAQKMPSVLEVMAQEATTTVPRELTPTWTIILDTPYMAFWAPAGRPMRSMLFK